MTRPRTRMLTFRVSDEEFDRLQSASIVSGARCLSEFLRRAAMQSLQAEPATIGHGLEHRVHVLESRISELLALKTAKE